MTGVVSVQVGVNVRSWMECGHFPCSLPLILGRPWEAREATWPQRRNSPHRPCSLCAWQSGTLLPLDYILQPSDNGVHTYYVTFSANGKYTLTVTESAEHCLYDDRVRESSLQPIPAAALESVLGSRCQNGDGTFDLGLVDKSLWCRRAACTTGICLRAPSRSAK